MNLFSICAQGSEEAITALLVLQLTIWKHHWRVYVWQLCLRDNGESASERLWNFVICIYVFFTGSDAGSSVYCKLLENGSLSIFCFPLCSGKVSHLCWILGQNDLFGPYKPSIPLTLHFKGYTVGIHCVILEMVLWFLTHTVRVNCYDVMPGSSEQYGLSILQRELEVT